MLVFLNDYAIIAIPVLLLLGLFLGTLCYDFETYLAIQSAKKDFEDRLKEFEPSSSFYDALWEQRTKTLSSLNDEYVLKKIFFKRD